MNESIKAHLEGAKLAIAALEEALRTVDCTDGELRLALSEVTDAYCSIVDEFCAAPSHGDDCYQEHWPAWNMLGSADHYSYVRSARMKRVHIVPRYKVGEVVWCRESGSFSSYKVRVRAVVDGKYVVARDGRKLPKLREEWQLVRDNVVPWMAAKP